MSTAYSDEERAATLQRAQEVGAAEASRETGVPAGTIRSWMHREGLSGPPAGVDLEEWADQRLEGARSAWQGVQDALDDVQRWIEYGDPRKAQASATVAGILVDKCQQLLRAVEEAEERRVRVGQGQGRLLAAAVEALFADLNLPLTDGARRLLRHYLEQAEAGDVVAGSAPDADVAREEQARASRGDLDEKLEELLGELRSQAEPDGGVRALPAADVAEPARERRRGPLRERVRERLRGRGEDVEVEEGEVVEEGRDQPASTDLVAASHWNDDLWRS